LIVERIVARPATAPLTRRIGHALIEELDLAIGAGLDERPDGMPARGLAPHPEAGCYSWRG
jgi:hypothetical protein